MQKQINHVRDQKNNKNNNKKKNHIQYMMCQEKTLDRYRKDENASSNNTERVGEVGGIMFKWF